MNWLRVLVVLVLATSDVGADDLQELVDERAKPLLKDHDTLGIVVGIWKDGKPHIYSYGKVLTPRGEHQPDGDTIFEIGSITKTFTGILLAEAVKRKEVKLDDPVNLHLPKELQVVSKTEKPITLLHLATHQSGLPREPPLLGLFAYNSLNPYADYDLKKLSTFLKLDRKLREPGEKYEYSNIGMGLLGHALVHAAKAESFNELVRERICKPLKLNDTSEAQTGTQKLRLAHAHNPTGKSTDPWDFATLSGAGALRSSAHDMLRYAAANMNIGKPALWPSMQVSHEERSKAASKSIGVGLGWHRSQLKGERLCLWHNGRTGGYQCMLALAPDRGTSVVILCSQSGIEGLERMAYDLLEHIEAK